MYKLQDAEEDYIDEDDGVFVDLSAPLNNDPKVRHKTHNV